MEWGKGEGGDIVQEEIPAAPLPHHFSKDKSL